MTLSESANERALRELAELLGPPQIMTLETIREWDTMPLLEAYEGQNHFYGIPDEPTLEEWIAYGKMQMEKLRAELARDPGLPQPSPFDE